MKRRVYLAAALLGIFAAVLFGCAVVYLWGAYPVHRHPYAYPFSIVCGGISAIVCIAAFILWLYYIIGYHESKGRAAHFDRKDTDGGIKRRRALPAKLPRGARVRAIFCSIPITAVCFVAGFFLFSYGYDAIAEIVHRIDK